MNKQQKLVNKDRKCQEKSSRKLYWIGKQQTQRQQLTYNVTVFVAEKTADTNWRYKRQKDSKATGNSYKLTEQYKKYKIS